MMVFDRSFLPIPEIRLCFESISPSMEIELPPYSTGIGAGRVHDRELGIHCPYRGEYTIGLKSLEISDFFQLFSITKKVKPKTFSVFPRIVELDRFADETPIAADGGT